MSTTVIINGVNGQDGSYLAQNLLNRGAKVFGGVRSKRKSNFDNLKRLGVLDKIEIFELHLSDSANIRNSIVSIAPDEFYNLAALSSVSKSWDYPEETFDVNATGVIRILEALKTDAPTCKFFQASSSEMFGNTVDRFQDESTGFSPTNPYGISKLAAYYAVKSYRDSCALFASNGILFNHESPLRPETYVSRKITKALARISMGESVMLKLGNLDVERDWGYAPEYVQGMVDMLQHDEPLDLVLATGEAHSIRKFVELAAGNIGVELVWEGSGCDEIGRDVSTGRQLVAIDPNFYRPIDIKQTQGKAQKAKDVLGWSASVRLEELASIMIDQDILEITNTRNKNLV